MKKFLGTTMLAFLTIIAFTQTNKSAGLQGTVSDAANRSAVAGAIVTLSGLRVITGNDGHFVFERLTPGDYQLQVSSMGYRTHTQPVSLTRGENMLIISLSPISLFLEPLEVKAVRASDKAPFTRTDLGREQIVKNNFGQDIPFLLNQTPSVVVNSDAGNGVGYTGIRIRGSDATRINVTVNGIPYNDAESMGTYFVDVPDLASSVNSIQIQRGVGTSSNGASAFGATINLSTNEFNEKSYGEINNSYGSFNTWKNTVKIGSGLFNDHFTVDARLSRVSSDGFIDRAKSDLQSFYFSTAYINKKSSLRFNVFSGKEKTYQAWYGVPENLLKTDRTYNPAGTEKPGTPYDNQTDNYTQTHYQAFLNHSFNTLWSFNTAFFLSRGKGYYEEYKAGEYYADYGLPNAGAVAQTDLVRRRWLDNYFYGQVLSLQYRNAGDELTIGGGWSKYDGKHYGTIPWLQTGTVPPDYRYYDYPATKTDLNIYTKWQHKLAANWSGFADLQYRHVNHNMNGFEGNPTLLVNRSFDFVNPKAGITYQKNGVQAFLSYALGNKEPNRDDFQASPVSQPKNESMHDLELGVEKRTAAWRFGATLYYMYYVNQLVLTGQINDVGSYTRTNIPTSHRMGIELQTGGILNKWINITGNLSLSRNKIRSYTEYIDNYDNGGQNAILHSNTDISFSPNVVGGATVNILPVKNVELSLISKYVGKEYMDNSQDETRKLAAFFTEDIRASWIIKGKMIKEWRITGQMNNLFNKLYAPNGYTYNYISSNTLVTENGYYPMAGTNYMIALNIAF